MYLLSLARNRSSIRRYRGDLRPEVDDILYCIKVANETPSGLNCQPWHFIIISSDRVKASVRQLCEKEEKRFHSKLSGYFKKWLLDRGLLGLNHF